ncbi:hypothetical protein K439DRAFT_1664820 [Ramaria rubella]|nr:hypothetical protein K439DRAFT_1664820 [Ramaria rubella]
MFYEAQERELLEELEILVDQVLNKESQGLSPDGAYLDDDDDDDDDEDDDMPSPSVDLSGSGSRRRRRSGSSGRRERLRRNSIRDRRISVSSSDEGDLDASVASMQSNLGAIVESSGESTANRPVSWSPVSPTNPVVFPSTASTMGPRTRLGKIFKSLVGEHLQHQPESIWTAKSNYAFDTRALFKRRIMNLYLSHTSLRSYVELNRSGFRKILKKYDKVTYSELSDHYLENMVERAYPFLLETRNKLKEAIRSLVDLYAKCVTKGDVPTALRQLRVHQREQVAWERDTVWRQMISNERRSDIDDQVSSLGEQDSDNLPSGGKSSNFVISTRFGTLRFKKKKIFLPIAVAVFIAILNARVVAGVEANNCFAILAFATLLWATEAIPLFVTSLFIPLLLVMFRTIRSDDAQHERLRTPEATKFIFSVMFSPTIMLLIGGFTIASALSKTNIDRVLITRVLSLAGTRPNVVLLAFMGVACFASMWISNVAAPTLCFTLIQPILRTLPPRTSFAPCLIIGIALAANIGGQSSPISSPQNLIALQYMHPPIGWLNWFAVAIPVSLISVTLVWLLLVVSYRPSMTADGEVLEIKAIRPTKEKFTFKQWWVTFVCLVTIILWCIEHQIEDRVGDMGVIAILPIVAFFSTGVLKKDDFEQFLWTIVFLAMGGIALGKAVDSSGLLAVLDELVRRLIEGLSLYQVVLVLSVVVLIISTFISHTIASVPARAHRSRSGRSV